MSDAAVRVLLIDDDPMQLELVERALSRSGFDIVTTLSLDEMKREAVRFAPHVVLIDVNMPDVPGADAVAAARAAAPDAKLVLYSAWEESKLRGIAKQLGADAFMSKSESVLAIAKKIRDLV